jgi:hypothetical protein
MASVRRSVARRACCFVLFSNINRPAPRRWQFWAVPIDVFDRLPPDVQRYPDAESITAALWSDRGRRGVHWKAWPQPFGFRIVRRLAERGRVAFVIFSDADRRAVLRAQREHVPEGQPPTRTQRVDGAAFARAMSQAGLRVTRSDARGRTANAKRDERDGETDTRHDGMPHTSGAR